MKLEREAMAHYLDTGFHAKISDAGEATFEIIGDDIEEMNVTLNSDTSQIKNILGQTKTKDNGYTPSMEASPFYADPDKKLYPKLLDIAMNRLKGDKCKTLMLEVIVEDTQAENHKAWLREVMVKPQSYGGSTDGVNIPFTVSEDGAFEEGYVAAATLAAKPTFTKGPIPG